MVAVLAGGARVAASLGAPATRLGVALVAVAVVAAKVATFHAMGYSETFSTVDTGAGVVPGREVSTAAGGGGVRAEVIENVALQLLRLALPWVVLLASAAHAFAASSRRAAFRVLSTDVLLAYATRAAALVAAMWVWWRSSWWVSTAYAAFALGTADALVAALVVASCGAFRRDDAPDAERMGSGNFSTIPAR
jgi:hypothetical protein